MPKPMISEILRVDANNLINFSDSRVVERRVTMATFVLYAVDFVLRLVADD